MLRCPLLRLAPILRTAPAAARRFSASPAPSMSVFRSDRLHNKTVFITGASGGIGAATAGLFARAGANVVVSARRQDALDAVVEQCTAANKEGGSGAGGKYASLVLDMQDRKAIETNLLPRLPDWAKNVDVLLANAGLVLGTDKVGDISGDEIDTMIQTNVVGLIATVQLFVREFKARSAGHIITLGSIAGREAYPGGAIYCASKFAVNAFTSALLKELVSTPIRVSEIQPGMVETNFSVTRFRGDKGAADKVYEGLQPLTPEDIAEEIVWCASRPAHVNVAESLIFPVNQASPYHNHRPNLAK
ncbi:putative NADP(+)-dependent dehydrogenase [Tilletiopsis washingtonensis]|uniref:Putative NADP(+)-dependent dehydrogenase n=1 Tax=Tilletiopsis washingtonensis TaxID=58919 RepID=A0A316Z6A0_9BASI|nr:putative NADP(+)-dependent dehydrogenase [Tilletiopsis washingtonensis]PWN96488.1 putative NADP(+)-dependent dehydrogenase [Tilletiopsis washingtonensis]